MLRIAGLSPAKYIKIPEEKTMPKELTELTQQSEAMPQRQSLRSLRVALDDECMGQFPYRVSGLAYFPREKGSEE